MIYGHWFQKIFLQLAKNDSMKNNGITPILTYFWVHPRNIHTQY